MSAAATPRTQPVRDLCRDAFRTETHGIDWRSGLAGALAAAGPLAIGYAAGDTVVGLTAGIGGLNTALVIPRAGPRSRAWWGLLCALAAMASFALASVVNDHTWSLVAATFVWVLGWAFLRAVGPTGALAGFATCAVFVVIAGLPAGGPGLGIKLLWFAAGCGVGFVLMVAARRGPELSAHPAADSMRVVARALRRDRALAGHALRLAVAVAAGTLLYRVLDMPHGYWIPLTTLAILQPGEHATHVRALQRAIGTLAGAALIILITLATGEGSVLIACAAVSAFWLYALDARGYFWLVVMLTPTVLLMLSVVDFTGDAIGVERVANSALGIVIGLAIGELVWRLAARRSPPTA
jgi:fusaric acid resistance family protein